MPLTWKVLHDDRLVHAVATGELSPDDIQGYLGSLIAERAMPYGKIFDVTAATALQSPERLGEVGDTVRLYDKMQLGQIGALAIVVGSVPEQVAYAEAFVRAASARRPVRMFGDVAAARAWLVALRDAG